MKFAVFVAPLLVLSAATVAAQPSPSTAVAATPDAAALAAAERLLDAIDYDRMMSRMADAMVAQLGPTTKAAIEAELGEPVDDELIRRLSAVQEKYLRAKFAGDNNIRRAIALLYARHFSAVDLDRLAVLQADPVMRKWNDATPELMSDMFPLITGIVNQGRDELKAELIQIVADYLAEKGPAGES